MAKRRNGEGSIRKRGNYWECRIMDGYKPNGRPRVRTFTAYTQREVREKLKAFQQEKAAGLKAVNYGFSSWADIWFEGHRGNVTPTTQEGYSYTLRILKAHFGDRPLREIRAMDIEAFLQKLRSEGRSDSALAQCRGMLFQIFRKAEANDFLTKNPVLFAEKMRSIGPARAKDTFSEGEVKLMMERLPRDKIGMSIRLLLGTGMRTQELLALEPHHIAQDGSVIQIRQAINLVRGAAVVGTPKSRDSYRDIPVPPGLRWCAVALREGAKKYIWEAPRKPGQPCNPSYFRDKFREAITKIPGIRVLTPHCCRHTYVSQMQAMGVDLATIQSIVGHADLDMTRHYLHVQEPVRQAAVQRFSEVFATQNENEA